MYSVIKKMNTMFSRFQKEVGDRRLDGLPDGLDASEATNRYGAPKFHPRPCDTITLQIQSQEIRFEIEAEGCYAGMRVSQILAELAETMARHEKKTNDTRMIPLSLPQRPSSPEGVFVGIDFGAGADQVVISVFPDPPARPGDVDLFSLLTKTVGPDKPTLMVPKDLLGIHDGGTEKWWHRYGVSPLAKLSPEFFEHRRRMRLLCDGWPGGLKSYTEVNPNEGLNRQDATIPLGPCEYCGGSPQRWDGEKRMMVGGGKCEHCGAGGE